MTSYSSQACLARGEHTTRNCPMFLFSSCRYCRPDNSLRVYFFFINVFETSPQITITQRQSGERAAHTERLNYSVQKMLCLAAVLFSLHGRLQRSAGRSRVSPHHLNFKQDAKTCPLCPCIPLNFIVFESILVALTAHHAPPFNIM